MHAACCRSDQELVLERDHQDNTNENAFQHGLEKRVPNHPIQTPETRTKAELEVSPRAGPGGPEPVTISCTRVDVANGDEGDGTGDGIRDAVVDAISIANAIGVPVTSIRVCSQASVQTNIKYRGSMLRNSNIQEIMARGFMANHSDMYTAQAMR